MIGPTLDFFYLDMQIVDKLYHLQKKTFQIRIFNFLLVNRINVVSCFSMLLK